MLLGVSCDTTIAVVVTSKGFNGLGSSTLFRILSLSSEVKIYLLHDVWRKNSSGSGRITKNMPP